MSTTRMDRRTFLKVLAAGGAAFSAAPLYRALAGQETSDEFFIIIHASGAWDVTVGLDPKNEPKGIIQPSGTQTVDITRVPLWQSDNAPLPAGGYSFELVRPPGNSPLAFGPGIGDLLRHYDRLTVVNGINMSTVSHTDGVAYVLTGRHLAGSRTVQSSIDTVLADSLGTKQLFPAVSISFASSFVGNLDRRAVPLRIGDLSAVTPVLSRSTLYDTVDQRDVVTAALADEARELSQISYYPDAYNGFAFQYEGLRQANRTNLLNLFTPSYLLAQYPKFPTDGSSAYGALSVELFKRNLARTISFARGGYDTHSGYAQNQIPAQQNLFGMISTLIDYLDATPHPTLMADKLSDHTHIMVVSDFCRTPMFNLTGGRDHYPTGSALVISPKFKRNFAFGASDDEQLLPLPTGNFSDGQRAITPPDLLATFLAAVNVDPRRYLRDGEVVKELLGA